MSRFATPAPLFKLDSSSARIDLSAWISAFSYGAGVVLIGPIGFLEASAATLSLLGVAYAAFLACVLLIQRHMRISLAASTFGSPQRLVTSGIFKYSRNPIYVAFFLPLASLSLLSLSASLAALGVYVTAMTLTVIRKEERDLARAFGAEFAAYATQVPRWMA